MSRTARWVALVLAAQAVLIGGYWLVERERVKHPESGMALSTEAPRRVNMNLPALTVHHRNGSAAPLPTPTRPTLVHIWATWCPPCRAELPGLLAVPREHGVDVLALALDKDWAAIDRFMDDLDESNVFLADGQSVKATLGVTDLPVTFLVNDEGRITHRFDGARDWTDAAFVGSVVRGLR